jgi:hypothetical protein
LKKGKKKGKKKKEGLFGWGWRVVALEAEVEWRVEREMGNHHHHQ